MSPQGILELPPKPLADPIFLFAPTGQAVVIQGQVIHQRGITICSTVPLPRYAQRRHSWANPEQGGRPTSFTDYYMPPAPRGSYVCLTVYDTQQWGVNFSREGPRENLKIPRPIPADVVATDLVAVWAQSTIAGKAGHRLGIDRIAGDKPTEQELAKLLEDTRRCSEWLVRDAEDKYGQNEQKNITDIHRYAATWLHGTGAERFPWFRRLTLQETKMCPRCANTINAKATGCEKCSVDLVTYPYEERGQEPDPVIVAILAKIAAKNGKSKEPRLAQ